MFAEQARRRVEIVARGENLPAVGLGIARIEVDGDQSVDCLAPGDGMILAHRDPKQPNWLDTEGRPFGLVFWRFMLPEGEIETPRAEVVPFAKL